MHHSTDVDPALSALSEIMPQLKPYVQHLPAVNWKPGKHSSYIRARYPLFTPEAIELPESTPEDFASVKVETRDVEGEPRLRLFVPVVSHDYFAVSALVDSLDQHIRELFGRDIQLIVEYKTTSAHAFEQADRNIRLDKR